MTKKMVGLWLRTLLIAALACTAVAAWPGDPWVYNQNLRVRYDLWQTTGRENSTFLWGDYSFSLGMPIATYRLGAIALTGTLAYNGATVGGRSSRDLGLNTYGLTVSLFPYRRFHLMLSYTHSQSPSLFGAQRTTGNAYRLLYTLRLPRWPRLDFEALHGETNYTGGKDQWTRYSLRGDQTVGRTYYNFELARDEFGMGASGMWAYNTATETSDTRLNDGWRLTTNGTALEAAGNWSAGVSANLYGPWRGYMLMTAAGIGVQSGGGVQGADLYASETASKTWGALTLYGGAAAAASRYSGEQENTSQASGSLYTGCSWTVTSNSTLYAQISALSTPVFQAGSREAGGTVLGASVGYAHGGDVPTVIQHALFFVTDARFNRSIRAEYPPGYVPGEVEEAMAARRIRQQGTIGFSADLSHFQRQGGGTQDWFRAQGTMNLSSSLQFLVTGQWLRDDGYDDLGLKDQRQIYGQLGYTFGRSRISATASANRWESDVLLGSQSGRRTVTDSQTYGLAFNSSFWRIPYGLVWTRYTDGTGIRTDWYSLFSSFSFRQMVINFGLTGSNDSNGVRQRRWTIEVSRGFDSLLLFAGRHRYN